MMVEDFQSVKTVKQNEQINKNND